MKNALFAAVLILSVRMGASTSRGAPGDLWVSTGNGPVAKFSPDNTRINFINASGPEAIAFDAKGDLFVADFNFNQITKFALGRISGTSFAGTLNQPTGLAFDGSGTLYETDFGSGTIFQFTSSGTKTTFNGGLNKPTGIAVGPDGRVYVAESGTGTIFRYSVGLHIRSVFASGLTTPQEMAFDPSGNLFIADSGANTVVKVLPDGTKSNFATGISTATGLSIDPAGNIFVSEFVSGGSILQFTPAGGKSTFTTFGTNGFPGWLAFEPTLHALLNVSSRAFVQTGNNVFIAGFIVGGNGAVNGTVVARALGPSLAGLGVTDTLQDPVLELHNGNGTIATNDNWKDGGQQAEIQALGLAPADDRESAILATLAAGTYTAVVSGVNGTTGNALVDVYNIQ
ncbi:MAG TPA: NHL repeat-containing protein [Chthoniobacterales bacterium]|jgi:sugar lactone lactonase YvrE|nr:NHL repeat-containing protein [Chthoniobacterales bacterium]